MKSITYSILSLTLILSLSSLSKTPTPSKKSFTRIVFIEIDSKSDSSIFQPYSKAWKDSWLIVNEDLFSNGSALMNKANYQIAFTDRTENLYTLLHPRIINGDLTIYSPYDPVLYGLSGYDEGELRYPITTGDPTNNFINSQELRDNMCFYLGNLGPESDYPMIDEYGDPIVQTQPDGSQVFLYPPREFYWYADKDIIKYKVRVRETVNKNGVVKKRVIESFAPVVHQYSEGFITGERELFWIDFNAAEPFLKEGFYFNVAGKPVTYLSYFESIIQ